MKTLNVKETQYILDILLNEFETSGFEFHAFKIGWYNYCVAPTFHQPYDDDTVAILIISRPDMFENTFLPFLKDYYDSSHFRDPIDDCMMFHLSKIKEMFPEIDVELIFDYELHPNRRPKILLQTAAHVSGAAYFYQQKDFVTDPTKYQSGLSGVCIHPLYGGWFAFRGVAILKNILCPNLRQAPAIDVVPSRDDKLRLLKLFNNSNGDWWAFRDIVPVKQKYSHRQIKYFSTLPKDRFKLIEDWLNEK